MTPYINSNTMTLCYPPLPIFYSITCFHQPQINQAHHCKELIPFTTVSSNNFINLLHNFSLLCLCSSVCLCLSVYLLLSLYVCLSLCPSLSVGYTVSTNAQSYILITLIHKEIHRRYKCTVLLTHHNNVQRHTL